MTLITFPGPSLASRAEVGGKGYSLIRMAEAGLPVPAGAVLPAEFFEPWFDKIKATPVWSTLAAAASDQWPVLCDELKALCRAFAPNSAQQRTLDALRQHLAQLGADELYAVRSSSPDEDLASASFAGIYTTRLGVPEADLEQAVRDCFASSLDARVLAYKRERGLAVLQPKIAVIVQRQIDSETGGVGFSLNPLNNDHDEAVVNANWGQGESVVAGRATPDQFVVDKVEFRIIERILGAKQTSIWLDPAGGTRERSDYRAEEATLSEAELHQLTQIICRIEALFEQPVDIEWACSGGEFHVLQARPITTYVPLAPEMMTSPTERRRLYADAALSKGMTTNAPVSPMVADWYADMLARILYKRLGIDVTPEHGLVFVAGCRMYLNLSNLMWLASPKKMARSTLPNDVLMGEILAGIDEDRYRAAIKPYWVRLGSLWRLLALIWSVRGVFWNALCAMIAPKHTYASYRRALKTYERALTEEIDYGLPLAEFSDASIEVFWRQPGMGVLAAALGAMELVDRLAGKSPDARALAEQLKLGLEGDVVVEMGIAMYRLAARLDAVDFEDLDGLAARIGRREMPAEFTDAWDAFIAAYGWRGPLEMDPASPRYGDDPRLALRQMSYMSSDDERFDPEAAYRRRVEERRRAYEQLMRRSGWLRRMLLRRVYRIIELFAGSRDTPKHQMALSTYATRKRLLIEGQRLVSEGRLDAADDVFDLTRGDIESARSDLSLDLRKLREKRTRFSKRLKSMVTDFPQVIDSRGRILRPAPRDEKPGELTGMAVSPGVVTGPVNVLRSAGEKPVQKGDILVAYTTDPGWTPLFVNAAAVVLEIGGVLQHGAVVAREYGKPCVVGIDRVMTKLSDGQIVEVDGTAGVVRLVQEES